MEWYVIFVPILLGVIAYSLKMLDVLGSLTAIFFGVLVLHSSGAWYLLALLIFLVLGYIFTMYRYDYKREIGVAEPNEGRRGVNPVVANGIIPTFAAIAGNFHLFLGSLCSALADTCATEIGVLYKDPVVIGTGRRVKPGTRGAISPLGEMAALLASMLIAGSVILLSLLSRSYPAFGVMEIPDAMHIMAVGIVSGIVGCNIDSALGAYLPLLSKEEVNLLGTLSGASVALALSLL